MPEYSYACDNCGYKWSIFCHRSEYKSRKKCPSCGKIKSVHRDYEEDEVYGSYNYSLSETKTLGHYADNPGKHETSKLAQSALDIIRESEKAALKREYRVSTGSSLEKEVQLKSLNNYAETLIKRYYLQFFYS